MILKKLLPKYPFRHDFDNFVNKILILSFIILLMPSIVNANTYLNQTWGAVLGGASWTSMVSGDIDNDEDSDLIHIGCTGTSGGTSCNSYSVKVHTNTGVSLTESSQWGSNLTAVHYGSIALGDIDNDGDLDLALSGCKNGGGSVSACPNAGDDFSMIYINNGTSFVESLQWKGDIVNAWKSSFVFGDIDLDGKLDIVFSGSSPTANGVISRVYLNNGTSFRENTLWGQNLTGVFGSSTTLVDVDNDGDLDLFLVGDTGGSGYTSRAYVNNGTSFVESSQWRSNLLGVELASTVWGDLDNNGKMDLSLIGHTSSDNHKIYNNTGNSLIQIDSDTTGNLIGIFEGTQTLGDYDNDGDLDLFTSGEEQYSTLYLNTISGFTTYTQDPEPNIFNTAFGPSAVWSDVDNDDDLDLILIGYNENVDWYDSSVYINNITTKNTAPSPPSVLTANYSNGKLNLSWNAGSDAETPTLGLYYNLRVGTTPGGHQIVSGVYGGGDDTGYFGNMMQRKAISLNINLSDVYNIYWSVQTIDTGLKAGPWATERIYAIQQQNDTTSPNVTITSPTSGSTVTSSGVSVSADYSDNSIVTCTARLNGGSWSGMSNDGTTSGTATHSFTAADGAHTVYVNCTDSVNSITKNVSFTIDTSDSGNGGGGSGGGGGGSGGGGTGTVTNLKQNLTEKSFVFERIVPGAAEILRVEEPEISVKEISIDVKNEATNVDIKIEKSPNPAITITGNVYQYVDIDHENISDENVDKATIGFDVEKSWISDNGIDKNTVKLNRHNGSWQVLETTLLSENSTHITYEAETPGFSLFAITGEKAADCGNDVAESGEQCDGNDLRGETCQTAGFDSGVINCNSECTLDISNCANTASILAEDENNYYPAAVVVVIAVVGGYLYYRKRHRKQVSTLPVQPA